MNVDRPEAKPIKVVIAELGVKNQCEGYRRSTLPISVYLLVSFCYF